MCRNQNSHFQDWSTILRAYATLMCQCTGMPKRSMEVAALVVLYVSKL